MVDHEPSPRRHLGAAGFLRAIARYFRPFKAAGLVIVVTMGIELAYASGVPILFQQLIDRAIQPRDTHVLVVLLAALGVAAVIATASGFVQDVAYARTGVAVMNAIRLRLFTHLQELSMGYFARTQVGDLLSRFTADLASVETALIWYLPAIVSSVVGLLLSAGLLFWLEWRLAVICLLGIAVAFRVAKRLEDRSNALNHQVKEGLGAIAVVVQENLAAQAVVKGFNLQARERARFRDRLQALRALSARASWVGFLMGRVPNAGAQVMGFVTLGVGAVFVYRTSMTIGDLVAFYALFGQVASSVNTIAYTMPSVLEAAAGLERVHEVLHERPSVRDGADPGPLAPLRTAIELDDVTFGYADDTTSLHALSLTIPKGASVAFVGASGSGKSTVLNLVTRLYDPRRGAVRFDGRDVRELTSEALRNQLGIVFQESILFDTSIRENVRLGRLAATDAEVEAAARLAEIHDFIESLPQGYETRVGERGSRLSGGQRQRVAIARALVREPSVLVLDEATSSLDPETEAAVDETIRKLARGRTALSVTHRLAPVVHATRVFVMDEGRIVEQGSHDELLALGGVYASLWAKQQGFTVKGEGVAEITAARLAEVPIFSMLDDATRADVADEMTSECCDAGVEVLREGEPGDRFYVVARGRLEVLRGGPGGSRTRIGVFEDGDSFGEIALLKNVPRTATVRALSRVTYLTLRRSLPAPGRAHAGPPRRAGGSHAHEARGSREAAALNASSASHPATHRAAWLLSLSVDACDVPRDMVGRRSPRRCLWRRVHVLLPRRWLPGRDGGRRGWRRQRGQRFELGSVELERGIGRRWQQQRRQRRSGCRPGRAGPRGRASRRGRVPGHVLWARPHVRRQERAAGHRLLRHRDDDAHLRVRGLDVRVCHAARVRERR